MYETFLAKVLVSFGATFLGKESAKLLKSKISVIDNKFYKTVADVSKTLEKKYPNVLGGALTPFFTEKDRI